MALGGTQPMFKIKSRIYPFELIVYPFPLLRQAGFQVGLLRGKFSAVLVNLTAHNNFKETFLCCEVYSLNTDCKHECRVALVGVEGGGEARSVFRSCGDLAVEGLLAVIIKDGNEEDNNDHGKCRSRVGLV
jgi:hypothetical protein